MLWPEPHRIEIVTPRRWLSRDVRAGRHIEVLRSAVKENAMHYSVQFFTWTPRQGVHQVGSVVEIDAVNPKLAAVSLLGLRLDETGAAKKLAVRVWSAPDDCKADCQCFYYH